MPADRWDADASTIPTPTRPGRIATRAGGFLRERRPLRCRRSSASRRARRRAWTRSSGCCSRSPGRRWRTPGRRPTAWRARRTGVYVGLSRQRLRLPAARSRRTRRLLDAHFTSGIAHSVASGRLSYLLGLAGPEPHHRHRLLLLAGRRPPGLPGAARRRLPHGARRRRQPHPLPRALHRAVPVAHAGARRPVQDVRRRRRRLRPRRGLRRGGAEAPPRCAGRRRPGPGGDPRQRGQPGRAEQRPHRAQRPGAGGGDPRGAGAGRRHARARSATSRRTAPAPSSATRSRCRRWVPSSGPGRDAGRPLCARLGQDQHRATWRPRPGSPASSRWCWRCSTGRSRHTSTSAPRARTSPGTSCRCACPPRSRPGAHRAGGGWPA